VLDPSGSPITFFLDSGPTGMSVNSTTGQLTFQAGAAAAFAVQLRALDGNGNSATQAFVLTVGAGSSDPKLLDVHRALGALPQLPLNAEHIVTVATGACGDSSVLTLPQFAPVCWKPVHTGSKRGNSWQGGRCSTVDAQRRPARRNFKSCQRKRPADKCCQRAF
jgi:hypothetical protein